jgi:phospholipase C
MAVDGGLMDRFDLLRNCGGPAYACMSQFDPSQIPNLAALARKFALSDATFQLDLAASWGSHLELVTSNLDGFTGANPSAPAPTGTVFGAGWGCDSNRYTWWIAPNATKKQSVPSCVPFQDGTGAVAPTPVKWVPTLMDKLDAAGMTYKLYAGNNNIQAGVAFQPSGYQWATCPTFADCGQTAQRSHMVVANQVLTDAANGTLPAVSIVTPTGHDSQHNSTSMLNGDNWVGSVVSAIQKSTDWSSTAIFIAYDDCGCFYDHVSPPTAGLGPRIPVVIVSPFAIAGHTDSNVATQASFLAYIEHNFGLTPLGTRDSAAYDFNGSFNYSQVPLTGAKMMTSAIPASSQNLAPLSDPNDTT